MSERRLSRLNFLARLLLSNRLNLWVDPEICELDRKDRKHLKWAVSRKFVRLSIGRTITLTRKGILFLKKNSTDLYKKAMNEFASFEEQVKLTTAEEWAASGFGSSG